MHFAQLGKVLKLVQKLVEHVGHPLERQLQRASEFCVEKSIKERAVVPPGSYPVVKMRRTVDVDVPVVQLLVAKLKHVRVGRRLDKVRDGVHLRPLRLFVKHAR